MREYPRYGDLSDTLSGSDNGKSRGEWYTFIISRFRKLNDRIRPASRSPVARNPRHERFKNFPYPDILPKKEV